MLTASWEYSEDKPKEVLCVKSQGTMFEIFKVLYGSRCIQLPLIEKLLQWLSGPSPFLSVATDRPRVTRLDSNNVRTRSIYSTNNVDDINAKAVEA